MKIIELNIGLSTPQGGQINFIEILNALTGRGFVLIAYRVQTSICKDGEEKCLAVKCEAPQDWQSQLASLSDKLGQDCIAVVGFIGHAPYDTFCADLWKSPEVEAPKPKHEGAHIKISTLCDVFERFYHSAPTITERELIDRLAADCGIPTNY
jgi:hypothetical protein